MRAVGVGFAAAFAILLLLLAVVGAGQVANTLRSADPTAVAAFGLVTFGWIGAWSYSLHLVLGTLDVPTSRSGSFLLYLSLLFANNVAPFSVLGSEPIGALFVSRATDAPYERCFAAVASVDALNFLPAPAFAVFGLIYFAATAVVGRTAELVMLSLLGVFGALLAGGIVGWRRRRAVVSALLGAFVGAERRVARRVPGIRLPTAAAFERQLSGAVDALERVASDRRTLVLGAASSTVGWVLLATMLWLSLYAVGHPVPFAAPLFVVPLVTVTDLVPLPGGVGGVETALVGLLVATTGVPAATAVAATLLHRSGSFLLPVVLGGGVAATVGRD